MVVAKPPKPERFARSRAIFDLATASGIPDPLSLEESFTSSLG